jgi:predicted GIY-YIG superfamily endonuclease
MYFVYLLKLSNGKVYAGSTPDLPRRVSEHERGLCLSTSAFRPLRLVWYAAFKDMLTARRFEDYLKTGSGQAFRNKRLIGH